MRIKMESLLQADAPETTIAFVETVEFPEELGRLTHPLEGDVKLIRMPDDKALEVRGHLKATVELICDRCLGPVPTEVEFDLDEILEVTAKTAMAQEVEEAIPATGEFDLSDLLRQHLILNLPSRSLCGCEPAYLLEHKPIDPRWRKLEALLSRSIEEER